MRERAQSTRLALTHWHRLVNNAGIVPPRSPLHETSKEVWDKIMAVNARGTFLASKYAICQMLKQEPHSSGDRGWIINIASVAGLVGCPETRKFCIQQEKEKNHLELLVQGEEFFFRMTALILINPFVFSRSCVFYIQRGNRANDETSSS